MFTRGTILTLKEPKSTEDTPFPYDRVRVIGVSPVTKPNPMGEWEGMDAQGVVIESVDHFSGTLDEPYGRLRRLYDIESEPEPVDQQIRVEVIPAHTRQAGLTPEEQFELAAGDGPRAPRSATEAFMKAVDPLAELDTNDPARAPSSPLEAVDNEQQQRKRAPKRGAKSE